MLNLNLTQSNQEKFFVFEGEKGANKLFVIDKDGETQYQWQRENERCSILLKPAKSSSNRAWIILTNASIKHIDKAMITAQPFLDYGDHVIISTDSVRNTVEKYENQFDLWHEYPASEKHKFNGYNVNCVPCFLLISEALGAGGKGDLLDIIIDCGGTVNNAEWGELPTMSMGETNQFPLAELPKSLSELISVICKGRRVQSGFVATITLGIIARLALGSYIDKMPLTSYFLTIAGTGQGKSSVMDYLLEPLLQIQNERSKSYFEEKKLYEQAVSRRKSKADKDDTPLIEPEKPTPIFFDQVNFSTQGMMLDLVQNDVAVQNSEARTLFHGKPFNNENREYTFGFFCRLWEGKGAAYRTKDINADVRPNAHLMMNLAIQDDVYFDVIANNDSYFKSGFMPRFLTYHNPAKDYNDVSPRIPFEDLFEKDFEYNAYEKFCQRLKGVLSDKPRFYTTTPAVRNKVELLNAKYDIMRSDSNPNHAMYRRYDVTGFLDRCSQHALKIAGILAIFENKDTITTDDLDRASRIVDFYLSEVVKQGHISDEVGIYRELLNGLYQLSKDDKNPQAPLVSTSLIMQRKILRDGRDKNKSIKREELLEHLSVLSDMGFVIVKQKGNKTTVKLHPKYRP